MARPSPHPYNNGNQQYRTFDYYYEPSTYQRDANYRHQEWHGFSSSRGGHLRTDRRHYSSDSLNRSYRNDHGSSTVAHDRRQDQGQMQYPYQPYEWTSLAAQSPDPARDPPPLYHDHSSSNPIVPLEEFPFPAPQSMRHDGLRLKPGRNIGSPALPPQDERDRSATPPPLGSPTPGYIALSRTPSEVLPASGSSRKLLVLDLNGTLLLRSSHRLRSTPGLRSVHPRPFLSALRAYLFAPCTRIWLDVMVWSSAQPHSVADMIGKAFGDDRDKLLAVWARDTLGLAPHLYCTSFIFIRIS